MSIASLLLEDFIDYETLLNRIENYPEEINQPNKAGETPLTLAIKKNLSTIIFSLLRKGVDVNVKTPSGLYPIEISAFYNDYHTLTALFYKMKPQAFKQTKVLSYCLQTHNDEAVLFFAKNGASIHNLSQDELNQLLGISSSYGEYELVDKVLDNGADSNSTDRFGQTPIMNSIVMGHQKIFTLLMRDKPQFCKVDYTNKHVFQIAVEKGNYHWFYPYVHIMTEDEYSLFESMRLLNLIQNESKTKETTAL